MQSTCENASRELKYYKGEVSRLEEEIENRNQCEAKVQEYVQTLIDKNSDLEQKVKLNR